LLTIESKAQLMTIAMGLEPASIILSGGPEAHRQNSSSGEGAKGKG